MSDYNYYENIEDDEFLRNNATNNDFSKTLSNERTSSFYDKKNVYIQNNYYYGKNKNELSKMLDSGISYLMESFFMVYIAGGGTMAIILGGIWVINKVFNIPIEYKRTVNMILFIVLFIAIMLIVSRISSWLEVRKQKKRSKNWYWEWLKSFISK